jgi:hypothetical protein
MWKNNRYMEIAVVVNMRNISELGKLHILVVYCTSEETFAGVQAIRMGSSTGLEPV